MKRSFSDFGTRGAAMILGGQGARVLLSFASLVILSRLVSPADYGLLAIGAGFIGLISSLGDFGLSAAALRAPELTHQQRSNIFWLNVVCGAVLAGIAFGLAGPLAALYGQPGLDPLFRVLAGSCLFSAAAAQYRVGLNRTGRYRAVAITDTAGTLIALAVSVVAAIQGMGAIALALQLLVGSALGLVLLVMADPWLPSRPRRDSAIPGLLAFGGSMWLTQIVNAVTSSLDAMTLGWYRPSAEVGVYNRSQQIARQPLVQLMPPISSLAVPRAAKAGPDTESKLRSLMSVYRSMAMVCSMALSLLIPFGGPLAEVILGSQWTDLGLPIAVLAGASIIQTAQQLPFWLVFAQGGSRLILLAEIGPRIVFALSVLVVARWGILAVSLCAVLQQILMLVIYCSWALPKLDIAAGRALRLCLSPVALPLLSAVIALAVMTVTPLWFTGVPFGMLILISAVTWALTFVVAALCSPEQRRTYATIAGQLRGLLPNTNR